MHGLRSAVTLVASYCLVLACVLGGLPARLHAESPGDAADRPTEPAGYREIISTAVEELEAGNYAEARERFRSAHALYPNARTLRGLGLAEFELKDYAEAARMLEQALASEQKPLEGAIRRETESVLERARSYLGAVELRVEPTVATVTLDGQRIQFDAERPLVVSVGEHVLEFSAPGRAPQRRKLTVKGTQTYSLTVQLTPLGEAQAVSDVASHQTAHRSEQVPVYKRWWLWTSLGVVASAAVVTTVLLTRSNEEIRERPYTTPNTLPGFGLQALGGSR